MLIILKVITPERMSISELAGFGASFAYGTTSKSDAVIAAVGNAGTELYWYGNEFYFSFIGKRYGFLCLYCNVYFANVGFAGLKALALYGVNKQHNIQISRHKAYTTAGNISDTASTSHLLVFYL